jgi:hypothetical protein
VDATLRTIIWQQFGAGIDMLENAMAACPDALWHDRSRRPEFWYIAHHTLFFLDPTSPIQLTASLLQLPSRLMNWTRPVGCQSVPTRKTSFTLISVTGGRNAG